MIDRALDPGQSGRSPRLGVVLGAGGLRGLAHIGALAGLAELGLRPDVVIGTSSGAIVGACYAVLGWTPEMMAQAAMAMGPLASFSLAARRSLLDGLRPLRQGRRSWLACVLDSLKDREFESLHHDIRRFGVTCYDLVSRSEKFFYSWQEEPRPPIGQAVLASAALPVLCPSQAVALNGKRMRLIDGGLSRAVPMELGLEAPIGARQVLAIDLGVATGWNERDLDRPQRLQHKYGDRLMILRPAVRSFGTLVMRRGDPGRLIEAGRQAVGERVARWVEAFQA